MMLSDDLQELNRLIQKTEKLEHLYWIHGLVTGMIQKKEENVGSKVELLPAKESIDVQKGSSITILYGTQSGNSKKVALQLHEKAKSSGISANAVDMGDYDPRNLKNETQVLFIVSTQGEGEPPLAAEGLLEFLYSKKAVKLEHLKYAVLALGDKSYVNYCKTGVDFDHQLTVLGAQPILERIDCDAEFQEDANKWIDAVLRKISSSTPSNTIIKKEQKNGSAIATNTFTRENPGKLMVTEAINLNGRGSKKKTIHLELSSDGQQLDYKPGDSLGIYFENPVTLVQDILTTCKLDGSEEVQWKNENYTMEELLLKKAEIIQLNREVIENHIKISDNKDLSEITSDARKLAHYIYGRDVLDLLVEHPIQLSAQQLASLLRPMQARLYSIASSPLYVPGEVHITVDVLKYEFKDREKQGVCSGYIASALEPGSYISAYISSNESFRLPDHSRDIIMIGPGTGVAPFRAFLQHREASNADGRNWLFFGSQHFTTDFIYQSEWQKFKNDNVLHQIDLAFSRDQQDKIYVQHRMLQKSKELFEWIHSGAHIYICGDKSRMARDVYSTLSTIISNEGGMSAEKADEYLKNLRKQRRYLEDVY